MSILVYQGDTTDNFGRYLPVPYIEKITIEDDSFKIDLAVLLTITPDEDIESVIGALHLDQDGDQQANIYCILAFNQAADTRIPGEGYGLQAVIGGPKNNIFEYYTERMLDQEEDWAHYSSGPVAAPSWTWGRDEGEVDNYQLIMLLDLTSEIWSVGEGTATPYYTDNDGNNIIRLQTTINKTLIEISEQWGGMWTTGRDSAAHWDFYHDFTVLAFSSLYEYDVGDIDYKLQNLTLLKKEMSDVAYEKVIVDFEVVANLETRYFDSNGEIYNQTPLQAINKYYYKTETVTHAQVVDYFNDLLDRFEAENVEPLQYPPEGFRAAAALKKMMNNISYVLETYAEEVELLVKLDELRQIFPDKTPATPLGRLWSRYHKRIYTINKTLRSNPRVVPRAVRNAKIFDNREAEAGTWSTPDNYKDSDDHNNYYIYETAYCGQLALWTDPDTQGGHTDMKGQAPESGDDRIAYEMDVERYYSEYTDPDTSDAIVRTSGYHFFDYEKALRNLANVNQIIDISKLENIGIHMPFKYFRVLSSQISRDPPPAGPSDTSAPSDPVKITSMLESSATYPITYQSEIYSADSRRDYFIVTPGFYSDYTAQNETVFYLIDTGDHIRSAGLGSVLSSMPAWDLDGTQFRWLYIQWADNASDDLLAEQADSRGTHPDYGPGSLYLISVGSREDGEADLEFEDNGDGTGHISFEAIETDDRLIAGPAGLKEGPIEALAYVDSEQEYLILKEEEHMYSAVRNFEPMQTSWPRDAIQDYRLMCFEFQDFMDDDYADVYGYGDMSYNILVTLEDQSVEMLKDLITVYEEALEDLETYKEYADTGDPTLAYDEGTGFFNEYFTRGIVSTYPTENRAPWNLAPFLYMLSRDLILDEFGGDIYEIQLAASKIINNINPTSGTYYALEVFLADMQDFYDQYYATGSPFYQANVVNIFTGAPGEHATSGYPTEITLGVPNAFNASLSSDFVYGTVYLDIEEPWQPPSEAEIAAAVQAALDALAEAIAELF